jgi:hypothetical protein
MIVFHHAEPVEEEWAGVDHEECRGFLEQKKHI